MRINQYLAQILGISRRVADKEIESGAVQLNGKRAQLGDQVTPTDKVSFKGNPVVNTRLQPTTIMLNKPVGYITSRKRDESGAPTVMDLLPPEFQHLKPVGRLDKESDGLLLLTDDGDLLYRSTHPKFETAKEYLVTFETPLMEREIVQWKKGIKLTDGMARADQIVRMGKTFRITLHQGKNRQIRRMAGKSGNKVETLTRTRSGDVTLGDLPAGKWKAITIKGEAQLSTKKAPAKVLSKSPRVATAARPAAKRVVRKPRA